jgi:predicted DNA-binding transcriptional regulator YafY
MGKPGMRVLAVLELLQAHGRLSGAEMAARIGVDGRTLRRYIATLEEMGIPVIAERGRAGGYGLVAGFKLPPMMFSEDEAVALSVGLLAARRLGLDRAAPAVASAQAKLERTMPAGLRGRVRAVEDSVQLDLDSANGAADHAALGTLSVAAQARRRVRLSYRDAAGARSQRELDTHGLAYHGGCWYAVGWCHLRQDVRAFRLDRIGAVDMLDAGFERRPGIDALDYLRRAVATLPRAWRIEVLLAATLEQAQACFPRTIAVFEQEEDGVLMRSQADDLAWFARLLAGAPFGFTIRQPAALREALRACALGLLRRLD